MTMTRTSTITNTRPEPVDNEPQVVCACCGRKRRRRQVHALSGEARYVCRRCGLWIALRPFNDKRDKPGQRE
jgi:predicted SprT family Zn-dependent metalloprotease